MIKRVEVEWGGRTLLIETGRMAKQTSGSVTVQYGESIVLVTAVASKEPKEKISFFPGSCHFKIHVSYVIFISQYI